ncbi:hypothetical protein [Mycolicibacterium sp.]
MNHIVLTLELQNLNPEQATAIADDIAEYAANKYQEVLTTNVQVSEV